MKYHLVQLGCQMNQADGERIAAVLHAMGYSPTDNEEDANLLGVVACSVRQKAIDRVYARIHKWNGWKNSKNLLTFVSGCILSEDRDKFLDRFDLLFSINELPELPQMIANYGVQSPPALDGSKQARAREVALHNASARYVPLRSTGPVWLKDPKAPGLAFRPEAIPAKYRQPEAGEAARQSTLEGIRELQALVRSSGGASAVEAKFLSETETPDPMGGFWRIKPEYQSSFEAFVPIQNGCDKFCTFCAVPYTRGREVSRPSGEVLREVRELVERGYKSITLLGQNVNSYGKDSESELDFPSLMREIGELGLASGKKFWVYFTSPHPRDMSEELLHVIAAYDCLAKQIHLPLQSGDDRVLFRMNRNHSMDRYREVVGNIRRILPGATLYTDIIVGFTGETRQQFENTKKAMQEFEYDMAFIAQYSPRPGAASSRWDDDVPHGEKKARLVELSEVLHETALAHNQKLVGTTVEVLVDSWNEAEGWISGRTEGKTAIRAKADPAQGPGLVGQFVRVAVSSCKALSLEGELVAAGVLTG